MARITTVNKAQKDQGTCQKCGKDIKKGDSYKWVAVRPSGPRSSLKMKRCSDCPSWQHWELTFSKMRGVYQMQAGFDTGSLTPDDYEALKEMLTDAAEAVREVANEYGESADNIEDGFGHETYQSSELREKQEALEGWADDIEQALDSEDSEPEKCEAHQQSEDDADDCEDCTALKESWWEDVQNAAQSVVDDCPV